jgi:ABC-type multidrug transport system fused ATPase/permease subunit
MPVLQHIDLEIKKGTLVALVGRSGAGKSTLVDLILQFFVPTEGTITLDGSPVSDYVMQDYRSLFGIVSQEARLFNATVAHNIAYAREGVSQEDIVRAAKIANADTFITEDLAEGYEQILGERGVRLSGGQRQRIAIARAVVHHPAILILDEATSSLDSESERLVQDAIEKVIRGATAVVIAHRLSTVLMADQIVVLDEGRIVERGTHEELLRKNGAYRRLYDLQFNFSSMDAADEPDGVSEPGLESRV